MIINKIINQHIRVSKTLLNNNLEHISKICLNTVQNNNKIILCGNGGSAADANHIAAELVGKFEKNRRGLPAISLCSNQSNLTSIGNDFGFKYIFSRQLESIGKENDTLIAISTSGNSKNIIEAINIAKKLNMHIIVLTGKNGGECSRIDKIELVNIDSDSTARIQEMHILIGHIICSYIEEYL